MGDQYHRLVWYDDPTPISYYSVKRLVVTIKTSHYVAYMQNISRHVISFFFIFLFSVEWDKLWFVGTSFFEDFLRSSYHIWNGNPASNGTKAVEFGSFDKGSQVGSSMAYVLCRYLIAPRREFLSLSLKHSTDSTFTTLAYCCSGVDNSTEVSSCWNSRSILIGYFDGKNNRRMS